MPGQGAWTVLRCSSSPIAAPPVRTNHECRRASLLQRTIILFLTVALFALTPLAQASPPDQTWIGGFYDDADYDDVVIIVTSGVGIADGVPCASLLPPLDVVARAPHLHESDPSRPHLPSSPSRASPLA
jgi:hypothetical protein